jgi:DNA-binding SARP family transcriptional activator/tetratricopeptide (TPR) repeat protein
VHTIRGQCWRFRVLGPLRVEHAGQSLPVPAGKQRALLAALVLAADRHRTTEQLVAVLWEDEPPAGVRNALQSQVLRLRRTLGGPERSGAEIVVTRPEGYQFATTGAFVDAERFTELLAKARAMARPTQDEAVSVLEEALALWRGNALADIPSPVLLREVAPVLERGRLDALELRARLLLGQGQGARLVGELEALADAHPLDERFQAHLVLALACGDRQTEALQVFARARRRLVRELGVEPGPALSAARDRVLAGDVSADPAIRRARGTAPAAVREEAPPVSTDSPLAPPVADVPHMLPSDVRVFGGRRAELADLARIAGAAAGAREPGAVAVAVIDGMAGSGKTALAIRAARQVAERYPDGQLFLDLHGYTRGYPPRSANDALATLLRALGVQARQIPEDVEERAALYRGRLAGTRTLVVLDNAACEAQVRPLIPGGPGCCVLVTSRRRLKGLDDAHPVHLEALSPSEAVGLFTAVAGRDGAEPADAGALAEIAARCGHLPLALRIAGALLRNRPAWTLADLTAGLRDGGTWLTPFYDGDRDLAAWFDLSYLALGPEQASLYRRAGLIPGPDLDAHAAAALLDTGPRAARRLLQDLLDHNLLLEPTAGRYRMHDLVRAHARAAAGTESEPERDAALDRLIGHYAHTAARAYAMLSRFAVRGLAVPAQAHPPDLPTSGAAHAWLRAERANLLSCLECAAATGRDERALPLAAGLSSLLRLDGPWSQGRAVYGPAAAVAEQLGDTAGRVRSLTDLGNLLRLSGDYEEAAGDLAEALELAQEAGDEPGTGRVLAEIGTLKRMTGDYVAAKRSLRKAQLLLRRADDRAGLAYTLADLGTACYVSGDYPGAMHSLSESLELYGALDNTLGRAHALAELAEAHRLTGDLKATQEHAQQAAVLARRAGDRLWEANALSSLGKARRLSGDPEGAVACQEAAMRNYRALGDQLGLANARTHRAGVRRLLGDHEGALRDLEESLADYRRLGSQGNYAWAMNHYAAVVDEHGDPHRAVELYEEAGRLCRAVGQPDDEAIAMEGLGACLLRLDRPEEAADRLGRALRIHRRLGTSHAHLVALLASLGGSSVPG